MLGIISSTTIQQVGLRSSILSSNINKISFALDLGIKHSISPASSLKLPPGSRQPITIYFIPSSREDFASESVSRNKNQTSSSNNNNNENNASDGGKTKIDLGKSCALNGEFSFIYVVIYHML